MKKINFNVNPLEVQCIQQRLNDLDFRLFKLEVESANPELFDKPVCGKSKIHSQIIREFANRVNSVEFIPNSKFSFTINIELK